MNFHISNFSPELVRADLSHYNYSAAITSGTLVAPQR